MSIGQIKESVRHSSQEFIKQHTMKLLSGYGKNITKLPSIENKDLNSKDGGDIQDSEFYIKDI